MMLCFHWDCAFDRELVYYFEFSQLYFLKCVYSTVYCICTVHIYIYLVILLWSLFCCWLLLSFATEVPLVLYLFLLISLVWLWAGLHMGYRNLWMLILYVIFNCLLVSTHVHTDALIHYTSMSVCVVLWLSLTSLIPWIFHPCYYHVFFVQFVFLQSWGERSSKTRSLKSVDALNWHPQKTCFVSL